MIDINTIDISMLAEHVGKHVIKKYKSEILEGIYDDEESYKKVERFIRDTVRLALNRQDEKIENAVIAKLIGLDILDPLTKDVSITEIMVNSHDVILVERDGNTELTKLKFQSEEEVKNLVYRIFKNCGRSINYKTSIQKATLPDGSRVYASIPPSTRNTVLNIRLGSRRVFTTQEFLDLGFFNEDIALILEYCSRAKLNIVICGRGSVGKTSLLRWLTQFIPHTERVITIEEIFELFLERIHPNVIAMRESEHITIYDLLKHALGMKADRIIIGESLGKEVYEFLFSMSTGHAGMTTIHTYIDEKVAFERIVQAAALSSASETKEEVRKMALGVINLLVFLDKIPDGNREKRIITKVTELINDNGEPRFNNIAIYDYKTGKHEIINSLSGDLLDKMQCNLTEQLPDKPYFKGKKER